MAALIQRWLQLTMIILCLLSSRPPEASAVATIQTRRWLQTQCQDSCGNVSIPYPFGIGVGCYRDQKFEIICNSSYNPPKPFIITSTPNLLLEVLYISVVDGYVYVKSPVISSCDGSSPATMNISFVGTPFSFSYYNSLTVNGCDSIALVHTGDNGALTGCVTACLDDTDGTNMDTDGCFGVGCCQASIPSSIQFLNINIRSGNDAAVGKCVDAFLNLTDYIGTRYRDEVIGDLRNNGMVELRWRIEDEALECGPKSTSVRYKSSNGTYVYYCLCDYAYEGNPYLPDGCRGCRKGYEDECNRRRRFVVKVVSIEKGVPNFWFTAMKTNVILAEEISECDEGALKYLKDIKWCRIDNPKGFKLEFFFDTNPYFKNSALTKTYHMIEEDELILQKAIGTENE